MNWRYTSILYCTTGINTVLAHLLAKSKSVDLEFSIVIIHQYTGAGGEGADEVVTRLNNRY